MEYAVQDFREMLTLARLLRRVAQEHAYDAQCDLFLNAAAALEGRAFAIVNADGRTGPALQAQIEPARHAPLNLLV